MNIETYIDIDAPPGLLMSLYLDFEQWPGIFHATISSVHLLRRVSQFLEVQVDHKQEGKVLNIVTITDHYQVRLEEFKPKYDAVFVNTFRELAGNKTRYHISASIQLKGWYRLAVPLIRSMVKRRVYDYVLLPVKTYAERIIYQSLPPGN